MAGKMNEKNFALLLSLAQDLPRKTGKLVFWDLRLGVPNSESLKSKVTRIRGIILIQLPRVSQFVKRIQKILRVTNDVIYSPFLVGENGSIFSPLSVWAQELGSTSHTLRSQR